MEIELKDILTFSEKLDELVKNKAEAIIKSNKEDSYQSPQIDKLSLALSNAQGQFKPIIFDKVNPYLGLGYTELTRILEAIRKPLSEFELSLSQDTRISDDATRTLHTVLRHSSGQWIESRARIVVPKDDIKSYESNLNAHKRMAILALLNIAVTGDPMDDDAEIAMADQRQIIAKGPSTKYNPREQSFERIDKTMLDELEYIIGDYTDIGQTLLDQMGITSLADLPKSQFRAVSKKALEIIAFREKGRKIK